MVHAPTGGTPTAADVELVRSAQSGEVGGLGLLLARHRGPMYAVALSILGPGSDAEDVVQDASRDWIWAALEELSPTLRLPAMLRYFTDVTAYEQIAALCEVPIGTVRSRLSQARRKLAEALLATADAPYDDAAALTEAQRIQGEEVLQSGGELTRPAGPRDPDHAVLPEQGLNSGRLPCVLLT
jgi:sigma-70-like protein